MQKKIKCPRCGQLTTYSLENTYRPFCSERCQLIDLGEWASNKYTIPVSEPQKNDAEAEKELTQNERKDGEED
jgi:uncharacterized protein